MSFVKQYNSLLKRVRLAVEDAVSCEMAEAVKDVMEEQTELQVYSYEASAMAMASRRVDNGGLGDRRNMVHEVQAGADGEITLAVEDTASFQDGGSRGVSLSDVVEKGLPGYNQPGPRPFVAGTETEAASSGRAYQALKAGLKRNGF